MFENILVFNVDFLAFFWGFGRHLVFSFSLKNRPNFKTLALGLSKKSPKSVQDAPNMDFGTCLGRVFFRRLVLGGFGEDLGLILKVADYIVDSYFAPCWDKL